MDSQDREGSGARGETPGPAEPNSAAVAAGGSRGGEVPTETLTVDDIPHPEERRVALRIALQQEGIRGGIALFLLVLLLIAMVGSLTVVGKWSEMNEWLQAWLPALTALLGSATGFYFATRR